MLIRLVVDQKRQRVDQSYQLLRSMNQHNKTFNHITRIDDDDGIDSKQKGGFYNLTKSQINRQTINQIEKKSKVIVNNRLN